MRTLWIVLLILLSPVWVLAFLVWTVWVKIFNFFGIAEVRCRHGAIWTPVHFYENPETKRRVCLVGMVHLAKWWYFDKVCSLAKELEQKGYRVLYEFLRVLPEDLEKLNDKEKVLNREILAYRQLHRKIAGVLDLEYQFDTELGSRAPDSWVCNDMMGQEFFQKMIEKNVPLAPEAEKIGELIDRADKQLVRWFMERILLDSPAIFFLTKIIYKIFPKRREALEIVLDRRNEVAARKILEEVDAGNDVVSTWGAAHLPGIGKLLEANNFVRVKEEWFVAYYGQNYSFWKSILGLENKKASA